MGNTLDKRSIRKEHADDFLRAMQTYLASQEHVNRVSRCQDPSSDRSRHPIVTVVARKRPLFAHEKKKGEFDVVTVDANRRLVTVHDCRVESDLKHKFVVHNRYMFDAVYSDNDNTERIYNEQVEPLVEDALKKPQFLATVLMFGQTGSGKTFTMGGLQEMIAQDIFKKLPEGVSVSVSAFEIQGSDSYDLLSPERQEIKILEDKNGVVHAHGIAQRPVASAADLLATIKEAARRRVSSATGVHGASSRSHAVFRVAVGEAGNQFLLVDLAGSERKEDSDKHNAQQRREAADINTSLMVLKECVRKLAAVYGSKEDDSHIPFRRSKITLFLKPALMNDCSHARTLVISTLSPNSSDTEHTICTLDNVGLMDGVAHAHSDSVRSEVLAPVIEVPKKPVAWTVDEVKHFFRNCKLLAIPSSMDGKQLVRLTQQRFVQMAGGNAAVGTKAYDMLKAETERVAAAEADRRKVLMEVNGK